MELSYANELFLKCFTLNAPRLISKQPTDIRKIVRVGHFWIWIVAGYDFNGDSGMLTCCGIIGENFLCKANFLYSLPY